MGQQIHARVPFHLICQVLFQIHRNFDGFKKKSCLRVLFLILSGYFLDAWGKNLGFEASDLCFVNTAL
jgi:hypothetical protein